VQHTTEDDRVDGWAVAYAGLAVGLFAFALFHRIL